MEYFPGEYYSSFGHFGSFFFFCIFLIFLSCQNYSTSFYTVNEIVKLRWRAIRRRFGEEGTVEGLTGKLPRVHKPLRRPPSRVFTPTETDPCSLTALPTLSFHTLRPGSLPEKTWTSNKSVHCGGSGHLSTPGPPQPRGELAGRGAHGDLLLTLHCPESKRLPMRKARRGTTFAFRAEGERGWTSCSITSPPRAQPQMTCKSQPSPSASGHGTLQEPLLKPICSILPLALTLADTWPGTPF